MKQGLETETNISRLFCRKHGHYRCYFFLHLVAASRVFYKKERHSCLFTYWYCVENSDKVTRRWITGCTNAWRLVESWCYEKNMGSWAHLATSNALLSCPYHFCSSSDGKALVRSRKLRSRSWSRSSSNLRSRSRSPFEKRSQIAIVALRSPIF